MKDGSLPKDELRARAERSLRAPRTDVAELTPDEVRQLVYDFEVHQIELEMQNEELRRAQAALAAEHDRYLDLYDSAPVGYLTLDGEGMIAEVNLTAAAMLGVERRGLLDTKFAHLVAPESQDTLYRHTASGVRHGRKEQCEVWLRRADGTTFPVLLELWFQGGEEHGYECRCVMADTVDLKRAEEELRQSKEHLRIVADFTHDWEYWLGTEGRMLYVSPSCERITGYTREEFEADPELYLRIVHPDDRKTLRQHLADSMRHDRPCAIEFRIVCRTGETRWIGHVCRAVQDEHGRHMGRRVSNRDITAQKAALEGLRRLSQFPEENPNPVMRITIAGELVYMNSGAREWLAGLGWEQGGQLPDVVRALATEGWARNLVRAEIPDARGNTYLVDTVRPAGEQYVNLYAMDITERKRTEETLERIRADLDRAQEVGQIGSWRLDVQRNVLEWSDENHRIFGVPKGTPMTYETFLNVVHPDDRAYVDASWEIGMRGQPYDIEHRIVVDGMVKWVREKAYLESDASGQLVSGFGITQDITERVKVRERLEAALEEKNMLLQELYHRTKNNMHLIVSMLNMQAMRTQGDAATQALRDMQNRILSMALVHEKLYQSKSLTHVDLKDYLTELVELLTRSHAVEHGRITVTTEMESMMVTIDAAIPCGLIANELVSNALQHAFPDGRNGRVELAVRALPEERIELVVRDNGVGLPPGMEIRAVDSLGLHAVVALAEHQLGGSVEATRDDGTVFRVEFRVPPGDGGG